MAYVKSAVAVLTLLLTALATYLTDNHVDTQEYIQLALVLLGSVGVWYFPNTTAASVAKTAAMVLTAFLGQFAVVIVDGLTGPELVELGITLLGAIGVYVFKNTPGVTLASKYQANPRE